MEMIAPLARVLAEANGIDWRRIDGSGNQGEVVEQDILNYLTRVMSGEEEPPATPVDLPPPDWNGEAPSLEMLSAAGVDSDIANFVSSARPANPELSPQLNTDALDFELEFEDEPLQDARLQADTEREERERAAVTRDPEDMAHELEDAEFAGAEVIENPVRPDTAIIPGALNPGMPARPLTEPTSSPTPAYVDPAQDAPPHPSENPMGLPEGSPAVQGDPEDGIADTENVPSEEESGWHDPQASAASTGSLLSSLYRTERQPEPVQEPSQPEPVQPEPSRQEPSRQEPVAPTQQAAPEPVQAERATAPEQPAPLVREVYVPSAPAAASPVASPTPAAVPAQTSTGPAAYRQTATLRLSFDASALSSARAHLSEHFGRPAPLALFVARAAARHAGTLGLAGVGVLGVADDVTPLSTPNLLGDFRSAVADVHAAQPGQHMDLMVVDAGELGLDELELPMSGAVLAIGRMRGQEATLTLTGEVPLRAGAAFLKGVAELLETPIRLML